jgi:uncharacterized membrane protein
MFESIKSKICKKIVTYAVCASVFALAGCGGTAPPVSGSPESGSQPTASESVVVEDLVIPVSEISETAKFYSADAGGTLLEVIAVRAPDGSIRTAFNTCQICYDSGRGYYVQDGSVLVCQNCGNRFRMSQVEIQSGGCNPVPIFAENKTADEVNITISGEYLAAARDIFANWKTGY